MKKILLTILVQYYTGVEDSNVLNGIQVKIIDIVMLSMHVLLLHISSDRSHSRLQNHHDAQFVWNHGVPIWILSRNDLT